MTEFSIDSTVTPASFYDLKHFLLDQRDFLAVFYKRAKTKLLEPISCSYYYSCVQSFFSIIFFFKIARESVLSSWQY